MTQKTTTLSDWLIDAKQLQPGDGLNIYLSREEGPPPTFSDMRAALYAQYGDDTLIRIYKHGQRISIFIHTDEIHRQRFDERSAPVTIRENGGKLVEIESGFARGKTP